ncbi:hypothetical protein AVEN_135962-1 [Araneus ventricosus]|uniref:Uncharacterized protein n=1 Tax=Araneus ventricosus TaxID=182803 RepID=A0A4Y2L948_ARAVE|nr:hypothetical protein AVEN_135962-1 [Araneus ventricosus]
MGENRFGIFGLGESAGVQLKMKQPKMRMWIWFVVEFFTLRSDPDPAVNESLSKTEMKNPEIPRYVTVETLTHKEFNSPTKSTTRQSGGKFGRDVNPKEGHDWSERRGFVGYPKKKISPIMMSEEKFCFIPSVIRTYVIFNSSG